MAKVLQHCETPVQEIHYKPTFLQELFNAWTKPWWYEQAVALIFKKYWFGVGFELEDMKPSSWQINYCKDLCSRVFFMYVCIWWFYFTSRNSLYSSQRAIQTTTIARASVHCSSQGLSTNLQDLSPGSRKGFLKVTDIISSTGNGVFCYKGKSWGMIPLLWGNVQCETLEETVEKARLMLPDTSHPTHLSQSCTMDLLEFSGANLQSQKQLSNITKWFRKRWLLYMSRVGPVVRTTACCPTSCAAALCRVLTGLFVAQVSSQPWNIKRDSSHWLYAETFAGDAPQSDYKPLLQSFPLGQAMAGRALAGPHLLWCDPGRAAPRATWGSLQYETRAVCAVWFCCCPSFGLFP